jgi:hypothetical protein
VIDAVRELVTRLLALVGIDPRWFSAIGRSASAAIA